ncbi:transcriptional regulator [Phormidium sp. LEGE 05292]|uniref:helix-turn-helix domain-containing transcriptional regulator n=1 Tax=[Phormidium] sp. LEGE 05292 TaxID=767427 RepID=UPI001881DF0D|nr:transcriptional regulator [Phormidium sp. LEGE 05292]MBE9229597.1 transcriptional regulator [Phormidium sp. LEGE 05292]
MACRNYHDYLIKSLQESERAAGNIEVALELEEKDPEVLRLTLKDVMDARLQMNNLSDIAKQNYAKLDQILAETGGTEIYTLVALLDSLGLRLTVTVQENNQ